jgi:MFS transporter, DHA1 family, inner membrane transport protein
MSSVAVAAAPRLSVLLLGLSAGSFLAATSGLVITPFLLVMADELGTDLAAVSALFAFSNLTWALAALGAGQLSDRLGRKPVLLGGLGLLLGSCLGTALASDYPSLVFWRIVSGLGGGAQTPIIFATAADRFPPARRGRALGWVMTGQSMALVLGTPLSALIGSVAGWRWSVGSLALPALVLLMAFAWLLPSPPAAEARGSRGQASVLQLIGRARVLALFGANSLERVCYSSLAIFFATYLIATYDVSLESLAGALMLVAIGNVFGNQVGGRLADRVGAKHAIVAVAMTCNGLLALPLLAGTPGVLLSIGLALVYNFANALCRPSLIWMITEISRESRGAIMGLTITVSAAGWLIASALGGWLISAHGFGALGGLAAASGLGSAAFALVASFGGRHAPATETQTETPPLQPAR